MVASVRFQFPTADLIDITKRYYKMYSVLLPVCTAATGIKATH
jgi:hypothetical protein